MIEILMPRYDLLIPCAIGIDDKPDFWARKVAHQIIFNCRCYHSSHQPVHFSLLCPYNAGNRRYSRSSYSRQCGNNVPRHGNSDTRNYPCNEHTYICCGDIAPAIPAHALAWFFGSSSSTSSTQWYILALVILSSSFSWAAARSASPRSSNVLTISPTLPSPQRIRIRYFMVHAPL